MPPLWVSVVLSSVGLFDEDMAGGMTKFRKQVFVRFRGTDSAQYAGASPQVWS